MRVALLVDHPKRDLPGLVLLSLKLIQNGISTIFVPANLQLLELWPLAPDFVVVNFLRTALDDLYLKLAEAGIGLGVMDAEGLLLSESDNRYKALLPKEQTVRDAVSGYFCWGPKIAEVLIREKYFREDQVNITGSPRMDFYTEPWSEAALKLTHEVFLMKRPMVLINSSFPLGNPLMVQKGKVKKVLVDRFGLETSKVDGWQENEKSAVLQLADLANSLARRFPDALFIYRPHPFEDTGTYTDLLEPLENLHCIQEGTVDGWILRASAVIQRSCSTAIEAGFSKTPTLLPDWIPGSIGRPLADEASHCCSDEEELCGELDRILEKRYEAPVNLKTRIDEITREWFYKMDGRAHERVAEVILKCAPSSDFDLRLKKCSEFAGFSASAVPPSGDRSWIKRGMSRLFGIQKTAELPSTPPDKLNQFLLGWDRSEKFFNAGDVRKIADTIASVSNGIYQNTVTRISIRSADPEKDYPLTYKNGRAVVLAPLS